MTLSMAVDVSRLSMNGGRGQSGNVAIDPPMLAIKCACVDTLITLGLDCLYRIFRDGRSTLEFL